MNQESEIKELRMRLEQLEAEYFKGNFSAGQDFQKYCRFNVRLKVPRFTSVALAQVACEVGDICEIGGKLYICTVANTTMTVVGTQS
jgi:hypothetical protein